MCRTPVFVSLIMVIGCGGSTREGGGTGGSPASGGSPSKEQLIPAMVESICANVRECCESAGVGYDAATCQGRGEALMSQIEFARALGSPNVTYDGEAALACLLAEKERLLACVGNKAFRDPSCQKILVGTLGAGESCTLGLECHTPEGGLSHCASSGVCVVAKRGALTTGCSMTCVEDEGGPLCAGDIDGRTACFRNDGLHCDSASQLCQPVASLGESCTDDYACAAGAYCKQGACSELEVDGAPCSMSSQCLHHCDSGVCSNALRVNPEMCGT